MVKLLFLAVCSMQTNKQQIQILRHAVDLKSIGYFQRKSYEEFMKFTSKMVAERSQAGERISVKEGEYMCHVYNKPDGLIGVSITDQEYPNRAAHCLIARILDEFSSSVPPARWQILEENSVPFPQLNDYLANFQDPRKADAITNLQQELDETKIILHNTIQALLQRGEKLDDLVAKSEDLSAQSKIFYKTARKQNQCCQYM